MEMVRKMALQQRQTPLRVFMELLVAVAAAYEDGVQQPWRDDPHYAALSAQTIGGLQWTARELLQDPRVQTIGLSTLLRGSPGSSVSRAYRLVYDRWRRYERSATERDKKLAEQARQSALRHAQERHEVRPQAQSSASTRASTSATRARLRIGKVANSFPSAALLPSEKRRAPSPVEEWQPPSNPVKEGALRRLLERELPWKEAHPDLTWQQQIQRARILSWQLSRLPTGGVFNMTTASSAVRTWLDGIPHAQRGQQVPVHILHKFVRYDVAPTMLCASGGHLHGLDGRPLPHARQIMMMALDESGLAEPLRSASACATPAQFRAMVGGSANGRTFRLVLARLRHLLGPTNWQALTELRQLGAGLGVMGAILCQVAPWIREQWYAEDHDVAAAAHEAMWHAMGQQAVRHRRAEKTPVHNATWGKGVEIVSLRCAPFSPEMASQPAQDVAAWRAAAIREKRAVMATVFARRPAIIIVENTAGIDRLAEWKSIYEGVLTSDGNYKWETCLISPHRHAAFPSRRVRRFYYAVLRQLILHPHPQPWRGGMWMLVQEPDTWEWMPHRSGWNTRRLLEPAPPATAVATNTLAARIVAALRRRWGIAYPVIDADRTPPRTPSPSQSDDAS